MLAAARRLLELLGELRSLGSKYTVSVQDSQGTQVGDGGLQVNTFPSRTPERPNLIVPGPALRRPRPGSQATLRWSVPSREDPRAVILPGSRSSRPVVSARTSALRREPESRYQAHLTKDAGPDRIILIERRSGVQVGRDNDQFSAYRATLPTAALASGQALADRLLSSDAPWSRDVFSHNARPDLSSMTRGLRGPSLNGIVEGPRGDTLVIVRGSRGVQVGDHNHQRNEFRIRVSAVSIRADRLAVNGVRETYLSRLRENPADQTAARLLADDMARAATADVVVDLTARVREAVGDPQIRRWSGQVRDRAGIQVGGPSRAHVRVDVKVSRFDSNELQRQILKTAARIAQTAEGGHETPSPRRATDAFRVNEAPFRRMPGPGSGRGFR